MKAQQSDRQAQGHLPGEVGVWVFILGDMVVFALFFVTFMYYRAQNVELFAASQTMLDQNRGALNTLLLLASSWFVVLGVHSLHQRLADLAPRLFGVALLCGLGFVVVKFFEFAEKISHNVTATTNDFFMYYFIFSGIHLLHVFIGIGVLAFMIVHLRKHGTSAPNMMLIEGGASYWHMVDLLW
ncbi:MAG: cytochrome c oxidase subunit 3, partial [Candidatus Binatia bacterium]